MTTYNWPGLQVDLLSGGAVVADIQYYRAAATGTYIMERTAHWHAIADNGFQRLPLDPLLDSKGAIISRPVTFDKIRITIVNYTCIGTNSVVIDQLSLVPTDMTGSGGKHDGGVGATVWDSGRDVAGTTDAAMDGSARDSVAGETDGGPVPTATQVANVSVPAAGGTVTVSGSNSALDGMSIQVPSGAYPGGATFVVAYRPSPRGDSSRGFNPISPLITINNGGQLAAEPMTLTIPVEIPAGHFAMAFYYNADGSLEGMPFISEDAHSVTVMTRHFTDFVVSDIEIAALNASMPIASGYLPGVDDWEFINYGSIIETEGHCSGQSMSSIWYYSEKKKKEGAAPLHNLLDDGHSETPWADNPGGYKLASMVQHEADWDTYSDRISRPAQIANPKLPPLAFAYSMKLTGMPQGVSLRSSTANGGHFVVAYKIDNTGLYVADPNYPGNTARQVPLKSDGTFAGYNSAVNAAEAALGHSHVYDYVHYVGLTGLIPWTTITKNWSELEAGTIGSGVFPICTLQYRDSGGAPHDLYNGISLLAASVEIGSQCTFTSGTSDIAHILTFGPGSNAFADGGNWAMLSLSPGDNTFGLMLSDASYKWADWRSIRINRPDGDVVENLHPFQIVTIPDEELPLSYPAYVFTPPSHVCTGSVELTSLKYGREEPGVDHTSFVASASPGTLPLSVTVNRTCSGAGAWVSGTYVADFVSQGSPLHVEAQSTNYRTILEYAKPGVGTQSIPQAGGTGRFISSLTSADLIDYGDSYTWAASVYLAYDYRLVYSTTGPTDWGTIKLKTADITLSVPK
jgi:hypothetical protein